MLAYFGSRRVFQIILRLAELVSGYFESRRRIFPLCCISQSFFHAIWGLAELFPAYFVSRRVFEIKNAPDSGLGPDQTDVWMSQILDYFWHGLSLNDGRWRLHLGGEKGERDAEGEKEMRYEMSGRDL